MLNRLSLIVACLFLASCDSTNAKPPPCAGPVQLPERALNDQEIEVLWGRDRSELRTCGNRLRAAIGEK